MYCAAPCTPSLRLLALIGIEFQVSPKRVDHHQNGQSYLRVLTLNGLSRRLSGHLHHRGQQLPLLIDRGPQLGWDCQHHMTMGHVQHFVDRPLDPAIDVHLTATDAEGHLLGQSHRLSCT